MLISFYQWGESLCTHIGSTFKTLHHPTGGVCDSQPEDETKHTSTTERILNFITTISPHAGLFAMLVTLADQWTK